MSPSLPHKDELKYDNLSNLNSLHAHAPLPIFSGWCLRNTHTRPSEIFHYSMFDEM